MTTPLLQQYLSVKQAHQDCLLLYRMGDFYELFYEDAVTASKVLGLTLTSRNSKDENSAPLAGFPYHALEKHLPKMVNAGYKVAVCEQTEDPATATGIVKREVVEIITRGTTLSENCLEEKSNNFLACICQDLHWGLSLLDLSTGKFALAEPNHEDLVEELFKLGVKEIVIPETLVLPSPISNWIETEKVLVTKLDQSLFQWTTANKILLEHFKLHSLESFGCESLPQATCCAGALLYYVQTQKKTTLDHITQLEPQHLDEYVHLDASTLRNLELLKPLHQEDDRGTLFHHLDKTCTAMGARQLKYWITHPLQKVQYIQERYQALEKLILQYEEAREIRRKLREINDIERILSRIGSKRANARDVLALGRSLQAAAALIPILKKLEIPLFHESLEHFEDAQIWSGRILHEIMENPPLTIREGGILNPDHNPELKKILDDAREGKIWLSDLESRIKAETGISTLKVGYNKVFGYFLEITKAQTSKVPDYFIRKQTLVNAERYITPEMKEWENKILNSEGLANQLEYDLFCKLRDTLSTQASLFLQCSHHIAVIDTLIALAKVSRENAYTRPHFIEENSITIHRGRHPVVEKITEVGKYIPNDLVLNGTERQILLMTGPNMAGKSTYLRQTALITLMAQMGCFVPADRLEFKPVDRIFTRVGASDRLSQGQSTFMVEMIETANILHNATSNSLVLLDEIGRGTSTFDGLSLAWAIAEAIHEQKNKNALTLFATHYHELTELPRTLSRVKNIQIAVEEVGTRVVFLHKVIEGACDSSYGIHVAAMAGLPDSVVKRAWEILESLEKEKITPSPQRPRKVRPESVYQGNLFETPPPLTQEQIQMERVYTSLKKIDLYNTTPLELMRLVADLQKGLLN